MDALFHRFAVVLMVISGLASIVFGFWTAGGLGLPLGGTPQDLATGAWHLMAVPVGIALALAGPFPALRSAAVGAALFSKGALVAVALEAATLSQAAPWPGVWLEATLFASVLFAGAVLFHEARREARWEGTLTWRREW